MVSQNIPPNFYAKNGRFYLLRCFACNKNGVENHIDSIPLGICAWCGWKDPEIKCRNIWCKQEVDSKGEECLNCEKLNDESIEDDQPHLGRLPNYKRAVMECTICGRYYDEIGLRPMGYPRLVCDTCWYDTDDYEYEDEASHGKSKDPDG